MGGSDPTNGQLKSAARKLAISEAETVIPKEVHDAGDPKLTGWTRAFTRVGTCRGPKSEH